MSTTKESSVQGGVSASSLLGVGFILLKVSGTIHWSWWWVLAPFWAPPALVIGVFLLVVVPIWLIQEHGKKKRRSRRDSALNYIKQF